MNLTAIIRDLSEAARKLGFSVRTEAGGFSGGRCHLNGDEVIMLNKRHPPERQLSVLAAALRTSAVDAVYLKPAVRRALEEAWSRIDRGIETSHPEADDA